MRIDAAILDWAGTVVDFGCRAPAEVFVEAFAGFSLAITEAQARGPMGMAKRDHIASIGALPEVAAAWREAHGGTFGEAEIDALYARFMPLQLACVERYADPIPGALDAVAELRKAGAKIGSTSGYPREVMDVLVPAAAALGYAPDAVVCAGETSRGRPWPYMIFRSMEQLGVADVRRVLVVDDTPVGIQAGRNAGCITLGVSVSGNEVGLSAEAWAALPAEERTRLRERAERRLREAGAHAVVDSLADVPAALQRLTV